MTPDRDLEQRYLWVVRAVVVIGALTLAWGLLTYVILPASPFAAALLRAGLVLLMATPVLRIAIAVAERIRRRDVQFIVVTAIVLFELSLTMWYAATRV